MTNGETTINFQTNDIAPAPERSAVMGFLKLIVDRNEALTKACVTAQMYCTLGDVRAAGAVLSQALTGL